MRYITISIGESGYDVHEDGKYCDGLTWGEMLEQVALLTVPPARVGHGYAMHTNAEWLELKARYRKSMTLADARLIAAAPELLAVVKELEESAGYWGEYDVPVGIVDRLRAAIFKATWVKA